MFQVSGGVFHVTCNKPFCPRCLLPHYRNIVSAPAFSEKHGQMAGFMCIRKRVFLQEHEIFTCCHTAYQCSDLL
jgi:hypothetical protein